GADEVEPHVAERVGEGGVAVAGGAASRPRLAPLDTVLGEVDRLGPAGGAGGGAPGAEELVAALRVSVVEVEPDGGGGARVGLDDVGAVPHVEERLCPGQAGLLPSVAPSPGAAPP